MPNFDIDVSEFDPTVLAVLRAVLTHRHKYKSQGKYSGYSP